jgi:hypothetical protein
MIAMLAGWLAESALMKSPLGPLLKRFWKPLAIGLAILAALLLHQHAAHKAIADAEKRGAEAAYASLEKKALELKAKADTLNASIAAKLKERNDAKMDSVRRDADALRLSGPGKALCRSAGLSAAPGGHVAADRDADASGPPMPAEDSAAVPWPWLVDRAEEHDAYRLEALAWREWWARFDAEWKKYQAEAEKRPR